MERYETGGGMYTRISRSVHIGIYVRLVHMRQRPLVCIVGSYVRLMD